MLIWEPASSAEDKLLRALPAPMDTARHGRDHRLEPGPRDQFALGGGSAPPRKAPVDFGDVFGGPPRRLSGNEDGAGAGVGGGRVLGGVVEEGGPSSRRWSASVAEKKPVFGEAGRVGSPAARRRHLGDDFFSDIFRGNESAPSSCPTPRRRDGRDLFPPSSPAPSRVVRSSTLPPLPAGDVFGGVSALPAHLSYSSRIAKSFDYSSFRSPPGFSVCQLHEDSAPDVYSVPSSPMISAQKPLKKASAGSKAYSGSGHFHFSIYKWASKGVTLLMPSNFKERTKGGSRLGAVSSQVWHREDHPLDKEDMFQGIHCFQNPSEVEDKSCPFSDLASSRTGCGAGSSNEVTEALPAASDMKSDTSGSHVRESRSLSGEEGKPRLRNLHELINENSEGEGDEVPSTRQTRKKEGLASEVEAVMKPGEGTAKVKQENRRDSFLDCAETGSQKEHSAPKILEEKALPARAKGRVKEYIKISKEEATEKTSDPVVTQTRGPKVEEKIEDCCTSANSDQQDNCNYVEASSIPLWAGQSLKKERKATVKGLGVEKVDGSCSPERSGASIPLSGSTPDSLDASFCNMEEVHYENMEECLVGELSQDHKEVTETDLHQEENKTTKMSDTRIQEWSNGKEGNIRSLLSTLQYVLWPGCGWKPVPLVDIIEGASVRRAYQRALLCLHPDKLQQKGAETHQKYIAEKVFDLLQEAWDHFNSLSSF